jgi:dynein heavy chain
MAGSIKRESPALSEDLVLMRSLRDSNLPKFVYDEYVKPQASPLCKSASINCSVPLFLGLIADLFPGLECPRVAYQQLKVAAEQELEKQDMRHDDEPIFQLQVDKVIQARMNTIVKLL